MASKSFGLHHISAISQDLEASRKLFVGTLGLHLLKRTVRHDAPMHYNLFYGTQAARPGSLLTNYAQPDGRRGRQGGGQATIVAFAVPHGSLGFWRPRLRRERICHIIDDSYYDDDRAIFQTDDGLLFALVEHRDAGDGHGTLDIPDEVAVQGLHGVTIAQQSPAHLSDILTSVFGYHEIAYDRFGTARYYRFGLSQTKDGGVIDVQIDPNIRLGAEGHGTIHHVAFGVENETDQLSLRGQLIALGLHPTEPVNRHYFRSFYVRTPGGVLFEVATRGPGLTVDEAIDQLGRRLCLPAHLEDHRAQIEAALPPLGE